jgi:hypothetical protein
VEPSEQVEVIKTELAEIMERWAADGYSPMAMAAVFTIMGLQIYKTSMNDKDFNDMMDSISASRDMIARFDLAEARQALNRVLN